MRAHFNTASLIALTLAACGQQTESPSETAADYASRIGGNTAPAQTASNQVASNDAVIPAPAGTPVPAAIYTPQPGAAPGPFVAGTATDPSALGCGAPRVAEYFGRLADDNNRDAIRYAVGATIDVRFIEPGTTVEPDPKSKRLNVMLDGQGIIRDARCG